MTESGGRRFAWAVFGLVVLLLGGTMVASLLGARAAGTGGDAVEQQGGEVVVIGVPGLSWSDITRDSTRALWSLAEEGAAGGLIVRGAHVVTCPADGWLTLGAGQRAAADDDGEQDCQVVPEIVTGDDVEPSRVGDVSASIPEWDSWTSAAARRPLDAQLGSLSSALASEGVCVRAGGPLAALGAADQDGAVPRYATPLPGGSALTTYQPGVCDVTLLDRGPITSHDDLLTFDAQLDVLLRNLSPGTSVVIAGLADRDDTVGVRAAIIWRDTGDPGTLSSATTRQSGLVQTTDLTATILALAGAGIPDSVSGLPVEIQPSDAPVSERVSALRDLQGGTGAAHALAYPVLGVGLVLALIALAALVLTGRRRGLQVTGLAAMAFPSAAFLAGLVPWWRGSPQWLTLSMVLVVLMAAHVALAVGGPWRRHPLGPPSVIAAVTVVVVGMDVILGGRLGLISILGVQPVTAGRFYGMGNVGYGIFALSGLLLAGFLAGLLRSRPMARRTAACLVIGGLGLLLVLVDGSPSWGADFGGVPSLVIAVGVLGLAAAEIRLTPVRVLLLGGAAAVVAGALMFVDWLRPAGSRTHLGEFLQSVIDGGALEIVARKLDQSLGILVRYPASWIAVVVLVAIVWAVLAQDSRLGRRLVPLWQLPMLRPTVLSVLTALVIGWALNDSGIAIVGIGLAVAIAAAVAIGAALPQRQTRVG
ncbi:hypothetical protein NF556_00990 [Ornithinimicrobium faecis]|uniref:Uncharacterized protein n=1 Tax=Ornithinimicrobium faecis TaxID=2934158 RepID=A0ABY4YUM7_9MICO|nr:hypothetical protein [Ornithinimicrobium sp. HY1793]USQ80269.1 hypothetical protein NF556_00990 [Ornithinimicrobium sp. HY1793]